MQIKSALKKIDISPGFEGSLIIREPDSGV